VECRCFSVGGSLTFVGSVMAAGVLTPPYFLSKKAYKYHKKRNSSKRKRILATVGAASVGIIGLPVLSMWGMCKTMKIAFLSTVDTLLDWLDEPEGEKELPDEYNESKKDDKQKSKTSEDVQSPIDGEAVASDAQKMPNLSTNDDKQSQQAELGNEGDKGVKSTEYSRKPKKRKFSEISHNQQSQIPLITITPGTGAQQDSAK